MALRLPQEGAYRNLLEESTDSGAILQRMGLAGINEDEGASSREGTHHPEALEQALLNNLLDDVKILVRPIGGVARDLLVHWVRRFELGNLKTIIRGRLLGRSAAWIQNELLDVGPFSVLPVADLLQCEDAPEMLRRLETTPYGDIARQARNDFEARNDLFTLDASMDKQYYAVLNSRVCALPASDQQYLRPLLGAIVDRVNLMWLLRYRFVYNLAPAHTYYLLIPAGGALGGELLRTLVQMGSSDEVIRALPPVLFALIEGAATLPELEDRLACEALRRAEGVLHRAVFSIARAFAYLVLREHQLRQVHTIRRGKQLSLEKALIKDAVNCARTVTHV